MMLANELREKSIDNLHEILVGELKTHLNLRMQNASNQLGDNSQLKKIRRNIARIKTIINQKKINQKAVSQ